MHDEATYCPFCGGEEIYTCCVEWDAFSLEEDDNNARLWEHQCPECGRSFWT